MWKFFILCMIWKYCVRNFSNFLVIVMTLLSRMISEFIWKKKLSLVELKFWALRIFHLHNFYIENLVFFWMNFFSSKNFQKYQKKFFCSNIFFSNKNFFLQKFCHSVLYSIKRIPERLWSTKLFWFRIVIIFTQKYKLTKFI